MKTRRTPLLLSLLLTAIALTGASADTIYLLNGASVNGKIIAETDSEVIVEIQVSASIKDERRIKREDIKRIDIVQEDETRCVAIEALLPIPNSLSPEDYLQIIKGKPTAFLTQYPDSQYRSRVKKVVETLREEKAKVDAGQIKLDGVWISPEEFAANRRKYDAKLLLVRMKRDFQERQYLAGMRRFEQLESEYTGTAAYPVALGIVREALPKFERELDRLVREFRVWEKKWQASLERSSEQERPLLERAFQQQMERFQSALALEVDKGQLWTRIHVRDLGSLERALKTVAAEKERLAELDDAAVKMAVQRITIAERAIKARRFDLATRHVDAAAKALGETQFIKSTRQKIADLKLKMEEAAKESESEAAAKLIAAGKDGSGEPGVTAEEGRSAFSESLSSGASKEKPEKAGADPEKKPKSSVKKSTPAKKKARKRKKGGLSFQKILMGLAIVLVMVTVGAKVMEQKNKK